MRRCLIILTVTIGLSASGAIRPAMANPFIGPDRRFNIALSFIVPIGISAVAYYMWKNSPAERAKGYPENLGPGEWYLAAYSGLSYLPAADWKFLRFPPPYQGRTAKNIEYEPGILGGIKFGRYLDALPWFGLEFETNFSRNRIRGRQGIISPPVPGGPPKLFLGTNWFMIWDMQVNLLVRHGFFKDKEVTFGRLQPYVGIGPGFEVIYARTDSGKNLAVELQAGVRYMCTPKLALFLEYKFSYQFEVELDQVMVGKQQPEPPPGTMRFDVPHHRFVLGVSYHFKNLYGN